MWLPIDSDIRDLAHGGSMPATSCSAHNDLFASYTNLSLVPPDEAISGEYPFETSSDTPVNSPLATEQVATPQDEIVEPRDSVSSLLADLSLSVHS